MHHRFGHKSRVRPLDKMDSIQTIASKIIIGAVSSIDNVKSHFLCAGSQSSHSRNVVHNHSKAGESKLLGLPTSSEVIKKITLATKSFIHRAKVLGSNDPQHYNLMKHNQTIDWAGAQYAWDFTGASSELYTSRKHRN
ncbi:hypothetical protein TNCV_2867461 [Trichonephila clavipes]|nr:hypothetical protein TNCV_2867461 [Trichonephila clavipes]